MVDNIIKLYTVDKLSIMEICNLYKIGKLKVKKILTNNDVPLNKKGGQSLGRIEVPFSINIENKIACCNKCGKEYNDVENISGGLTTHLLECRPEIIHPSEAIKRNVKKYEGKYWHFDYFTLKEKTHKEFIKCAECDWTSTDITNISGAYTKHIENEHNNLNDFLSKYPNEIKFFNTHNNRKEREEKLINDFVTCKICGMKMLSVNEIHLQTKHNISLSEYKIKYLGEKTVSISTSDKLKQIYNDNLKLYENSFKSNAEEEITTIIKSFGFEVLNNDKKTLNGTEIDIFIPELNLAYEYNGLYYHSEKMGKNRWYHLNKQKLAEENNIKLIHIFEDEWINKKQIVINKIIHLLKKNNNKKIYGRQVKVTTINKDIAFDFLNENHLQGQPPEAKINIGAYFNDELVGVMSFIEQKNNWELVRYASHNNYRLIGVPSKMLSKLTHNNKNIISFADRRWTTNSKNNLYTQLGFELVNILKPDYRYINFKISRNLRIHKFNFRKKTLLKKYPELLNNNMTENEMTKLIGCDKIWDCGLFKYEYKIKKGPI
jgi:hypothetical protein